VQAAPQTAFPPAPEGFCVQSVVENVHGVHIENFILHICDGLTRDEAHNIAKCTSCSA